MSSKSFCVILRFYHSCNVLQLNKYVTRVRQRGKLAWQSFEKKRGRAMLLADMEPEVIIRLTQKSSSAFLKYQTNPELSLNASQRLAFVYHQKVRQIVEDASTKLGSLVEITEIEFRNGLQEILCTWKKADGVNLSDSELRPYFRQLSKDICKEMASSSLCADRPEISFELSRIEQTNKELVDNLLEDCDLGANYSPLDEPMAEHPSLLASRQQATLREIVNRDLGLIKFSEISDDEPHTHVVDGPQSPIAGVYGLNRDGLMAKVRKTR